MTLTPCSACKKRTKKGGSASDSLNAYSCILAILVIAVIHGTEHLIISTWIRTLPVIRTDMHNTVYLPTPASLYYYLPTYHTLASLPSTPPNPTHSTLATTPQYLPKQSTLVVPYHVYLCIYIARTRARRIVRHYPSKHSRKLKKKKFLLKKKRKKKKGIAALKHM